MALRWSDTPQCMALKDYNTESIACTKKILNLWRKGLFKVKKSLKQFQSNIQEFDNLIKANQNKAKEFNIGSKIWIKTLQNTRSAGHSNRT